MSTNQREPDYWQNLEAPPTSSRDFMDASAALEAFKKWAESQGTDLPPSDHVMLFTGWVSRHWFDTGMVGLALKLVRLAQNGTNPELFQIRFQCIWRHRVYKSISTSLDT